MSFQATENPSMWAEPKADANVIRSIYGAMINKDAREFERYMRLAGPTDIYFTSQNSPNPKRLGSVVGLCASGSWIDGLLVCRDLGVHPDRNRLIRDPFVWSAFLGDEVGLRILREMGADPMAKIHDDRMFGIDRKIDSEMGDTEVGECDLSYMGSLSKTQHSFRPRACALMLNQIRPGTCAIVTFLSSFQSVRSSAEFAWYLRFLYASALKEGNREVMATILDLYDVESALESTMERVNSGVLSVSLNGLHGLAA